VMGRVRERGRVEGERKERKKKKKKRVGGGGGKKNKVPEKKKLRSGLRKGKEKKIQPGMEQG